MWGGQCDFWGGAGSLGICVDIKLGPHHCTGGGGGVGCVSGGLSADEASLGVVAGMFCGRGGRSDKTIFVGILSCGVFGSKLCVWYWWVCVLSRLIGCVPDGHFGTARYTWKI
uniref:Transmembrane protein n=1 Tax=Knipowitschia caucasica TaxID=637954 RepID=A0AAV2MQ66_KNICA